jgi:hypothetical protein
MTKALVLTGISGGHVGATTVIVGRSNVVGSGSGCDVLLQERMVLPRHAELRQILERWFVVPLDSTAQVYINGQPVSGQARLTEGSTLTLGIASFRVGQTEVAEQEVGETQPSSNGVPRLGEYLIRRGTLTRAQIQHAVQRQDELQQQGRRMQFGDVLYELGYANRNQLEQAAQEQRNDFYERFRD